MAIRRTKQIRKKKINLPPGVKINPNMKDYSNEPLFLEMRRKALERINKYGLPAEIEKRLKENNSYL